jgi:hypothetical protein
MKIIVKNTFVNKEFDTIQNALLWVQTLLENDIACEIVFV